MRAIVHPKKEGGYKNTESHSMRQQQVMPAGKGTILRGHLVCMQNKRQEAISSQKVPNNWQSGELTVKT